MTLEPFDLRRTSGAFLLEVLRRRAEAAPDDAEALRRYELGCDVYIKQWSYAALNKAFFWLALLASLAVLIWPALLAGLPALSGITLVASAVTQTMATAVAAFLVGLYLHYKGRQTSAETLLRALAFGEEATGRMAERVSEELARIDRGVAFRAEGGEGEAGPPG
jgi:hypothetical protein